MHKCASKAKREEIVNVLMAARDTTASVITSMVYELAKNKDIQERTRAEVISILGVDGDLTFKDVKALVLLRAVLNETLRYELR